jgi:hypothetical protein
VGHISERILWRISAVVAAVGFLGMFVTGLTWIIVGKNPQFASWGPVLSTGFLICGGLMLLGFVLVELDSSWRASMSPEQRMQKKLRQELDDGTFLAACNVSQQDK